MNPAEVKLIADNSPFYIRALLYLESQWRQQIPTDVNLHIGHQAAMDLMPYQLDPAKLALQRPRQRILIADTVGLGKILEAGILMTELIFPGKREENPRSYSQEHDDAVPERNVEPFHHSLLSIH